MVDIHTHIIPGIDDGPKTIEAMLEMARRAVDDGVTTLVATPHAFWGSTINDESVIQVGVARVREELEEAGIPLQVVPGCEVPMNRTLLARIPDNPSWTIAGAGAYLLLEPPWSGLPSDWLRIVGGFVADGITPIIAHPERSPDLKTDPEKIRELVRAGALTQVTANSFLGRHGGTERELAFQLLQDGLVHVVSSDAHNAENRAPVLSEARLQVAEAVGEETARQLFEQNPRNIVDGMPVLETAAAAASRRGDEEGARSGRFGSLFRRGRRR